MRSWTAEEVAAAAGARLVQPPPGGAGPAGAVIDSREAGPDLLFVGLPGANVDGGRFAPQALDAGAWGVLVAPEHAEAARGARPAALLVAEDPLRALQDLARAWRRALAPRVIAVTGSTGKTSTKDILAALLAERVRTVASPQNLNTEIGMPLAILDAPAGTEALVLEAAMRGRGQIAELARICEPDVGVITNVGPVHLELLGSIEAVAEAKAELIADLRPGATAVVPADEPLLDRHLREQVRTLTFGEGGDVDVAAVEELSVGGARVTLSTPEGTLELEVPFSARHQLTNLCAATAAALAVGVRPDGRVDVRFSALRGERIELPGRILIINDCYNANPMSMRAALDELVATAPGRRIAVLGDMLELGPDSERFHVEVARHARELGIEELVTVGPLAAGMAEPFGGGAHVTSDAHEAADLLGTIARPGDTILVKGSRGVGLEVVAEAMR